MSETRETTKGSVNLDAALREWPEVQKAEGDWEGRTQSVLDRLQRGERGATSAYVSDEDLLSAPLGQSSADSHNSADTRGSPVNQSPAAKKESGTPMTMPADRERDRRSLQDLAKMASDLTAPPPSVGSMPSGVHRAAEAKKDDSGIVDLAAAAQADPEAATRAQTTPLASQGLFDEEPQSHRPPVAAPMSAPATTPSLTAQTLPQQPAPSIPPTPASVPPASLSQHTLAPSAPAVGLAPARASAPPALAKKKGSVIALALGGFVALGAAAAATLLVSKPHTSEDAVATRPAAMAPAEPATAAEPSPAPPKPVADLAPTPEPGLDTTGADPNVLPAAATPNAKLAVAPKGIAAKAAPAGKPATQEAAPKAEGPTKLTQKDLLAAAPSEPAGDLGAAMKKEVGDEPAKTAAAATTGGNASTGNVPQKPSQGAVTGAIGAVLPQARACLGPDDPISRASIVFSSAGSVQSVNVSGAASGKPAEACIKDALMKAKLQPFAEPAYTANITIRHN